MGWFGERGKKLQTDTKSGFFPNEGKATQLLLDTKMRCSVRSGAIDMLWRQLWQTGYAGHYARVGSIGEMEMLAESNSSAAQEVLSGDSSHHFDIDRAVFLVLHPEFDGEHFASLGHHNFTDMAGDRPVLAGGADYLFKLGTYMKMRIFHQYDDLDQLGGQTGVVIVGEGYAVTSRSVGLGHVIGAAGPFYKGGRGCNFTQVEIPVERGKFIGGWETYAIPGINVVGNRLQLT